MQIKLLDFSVSVGFSIFTLCPVCKREERGFHADTAQMADMMEDYLKEVVTSGTEVREHPEGYIMNLECEFCDNSI